MILLGASNLTAGLPEVVAAARGRLGAPLEILAAIGHGRAFGVASRYFARGLGPILDCGLWRQLAERPIHAVLADAGNDLMYGAAPEAIAGWIDTALGRLPAGSRAVLLLPPLDRLRRLGWAGYYLARSLFYPGRSLSHDRALAAVEELCQRLLAVAEERQAEVVEPPVSWYRSDPIHIARSQRQAAWHRVVAGWGKEAFPGAGLSAGDRLRLLTARPLRRTVFGLELRRAQPSARLSDGSRISLF